MKVVPSTVKLVIIFRLLSTFVYFVQLFEYVDFLPVRYAILHFHLTKKSLDFFIFYFFFNLFIYLFFFTFLRLAVQLYQDMYYPEYSNL